RLLRGFLFGAGAGRWLVRRGRKWRWARSTVSAVMNATNEHDMRLSSLLRRIVEGSRGKRRG
ncbi:MAG: hypothetical protein R6T96_11660, partial [Longimicrobiales bacterium]